MSLFKILRGSSSRIDTTTTPFHDGYAYFTPDNGGFYIDAEDGGEQKRIRISSPSGDPSLMVTTVLSVSGWSSAGKQTVTVSGLGADQNGIVGISQNITDEQFTALTSANLYVESQSEGAITIAAAGDVPSCDIPIAIMMFPGEEAAGTSVESGVSNFNGRVGAVLPESGDYTAAMVGADAIGTAASAVSSHNASSSAHSDIRSALAKKEDAGAAATVQSNLDTHTTDTTVHVTAAEKAAWNAKADASKYLPLTGGTIAGDLVIDANNGYIDLGGEGYLDRASSVLESVTGGLLSDANNLANIVATESGYVFVGDSNENPIQIKNVATPTEDNDAANKGYVDNIKPKTVTISLSTTWTGTASPYTQTVTVSGGTSTCKVDLQPDATAFAHMVSVGCNALFVVNNSGTFTAYAIGAKTTTALSIQATVTEVS